MLYNIYEVVAILLMFLACITGSWAWLRAADEHVKAYAKDIRRGL